MRVDHGTCHCLWVTNSGRTHASWRQLDHARELEITRGAHRSLSLTSEIQQFLMAALNSLEDEYGMWAILACLSAVSVCPRLQDASSDAETDIS